MLKKLCLHKETVRSIGIRSGLRTGNKSSPMQAPKSVFAPPPDDTADQTGAGGVTPGTITASFAACGGGPP